jgi:nitroimidazol reductase NimA-like FMN-containing flavoprotein (pyridoxamine 5'-phosphate oxidase superfamily)
VKASPRSADGLTPVRLRFRDLPVAHVASANADGTPHVVPLWFVWLEDAVYVTCREGSQVAANLRQRPIAAVELDHGVHWTDQAGVMIRGPAEVLDAGHPGARRALSAWFEKYREHLSGDGFARYTARVEHPLVVRVDPHRVSGWNHAADEA